MKYIIVGRDTCRWCNQAQQLLDEKKYKYEFIDSHELNPKDVYYKHIPIDYNFIPKILLINNKMITWIGGYEDLVKHLSTIKKKSYLKIIKVKSYLKKVKLKTQKRNK